MAIQRLAGSEAAGVELRTTMANTIAAQMMPAGAVKGGTSLKFRYGNLPTRFTTDLDTARGIALEAFVERYAERLAEGWEGFTGRIVRRNPAEPEGVPAAYVMQPYEIKLDYLGKPWCTVRLEIGHDEIGDADDPEFALDESIRDVFRKLCFPAPAPVAVMALPHQVAQKLHGASTPGSERAHDLIDLQIIMRNSDVSLTETRRVCEKLFAYRRAQAWPPVLEVQPGWKSLYASQAAGLEVLPTVEEAITWANDLIHRIDEAR